MKKNLFLLYCFIMVTSLSSCLNSNSNITSHSKKSIEDDFIPYASDKELDYLMENGFVNYKISRYFANIAMRDFSQSNGWEDSVLSDYPIIIYSQETGKPRYYEFRVLKDNNQIGAISCAANQDEGDAVQFILPYVLEIEDQNVTRAIISGDWKIIDLNYPSSLYLKSTNTNRMINNNGNIVEGELCTDLTIQDFLNNSSILDELGIDESQVSTLVDLKESFEEENKEYWNFIKENEEIILATTDEEIQSIYDRIYGDSSSRGIKTTTTKSENLLYDWSEKVTWYNPGGWCGPSCISFITLGLGEKSGYNDVPLFNDAKKIKKMYEDFEDEIGTGPKVFSHLNKGLSALTDYKLVNDFGHLYSTISSNVSKYQLPCISLRGSKGLSSDTIQWHYRTIIGTKTVTKKTKITAFNKTLLTFKDVDNYYAIHDNGTDGDPNKYFFESSFKLYHLWSAHVEEK